MQNFATNIVEIESALIGGALHQADKFDDILTTVKTPEYFTDEKHRLIYSAMLELYEKNQPIEINLVANLLYEKEKLTQAGGRSYMITLAENPGLMLTEYCRIIKNNYQVRQLRDSFRTIVNQSTEPGVDAQNLINEAERCLLNVMQYGGDEGVKTIAELTKEFVDNVCRVDKPEKIFIETRIAGLNNLITGFFRGDMIIVAGPPSMGKTMFATDFCLYNMKKYNSLFVSLDQSSESIIQRQLTAMTGITKKEMFTGTIDERRAELLCRAAVNLANADRLFITDQGDLTILDIRSMARRVKRTKGLDILVIDYIQLVRGHRYFENRNLELAEISRITKSLAKELDIVVLVLSQLSRDYKNATLKPENNQWGFPNRTMLRDSGSLEQDANVIIFPHVPYEVMKSKYGTQSNEFITWLRSSPDNETLSYIVVDKNKDGETGTVQCCRDSKRMRFYSEDKLHDGCCN